MKPQELQSKLYPKKVDTPAEEQAETKQENPHPMNLLAAHVFAARNATHREHWKVKGGGAFAAHMALGEFYDAIIDKIDEIVEVDQGMYGLIGDFTIEDIKPADFAAYIRGEAQWIELNRDKFSKCAATLALIDDLTAIYLRTAYKLSNLS